MRRITLLAIVAALSLGAAKAADVFVPGKLKREFWPGQTIAAVTNGTAGAATESFIDSFETPVDVGDNYAVRISGFFVPPSNGNYVFIVASDDGSVLYLSTNDQPATKRLIAQESGWTASRNWITNNGGAANDPQRRSDQWSPDAGVTVPYAAGIPLNGGTRYYIEGVMQEGGGGDNLAVFYKLIADPDPVDGDPPNTTNGVIGILVPEVAISITSQPASRRVLTNQTVTFSVGVNTPNARFQWFRNGTAIPNATNATHQTAPLTAGDNGSTHYVVASNAVNTVQSSNAVITIGNLVQVPGAKQEFWDNLTRDDLITPGFATPPDSELSLTAFETPNNQTDSFAVRVTALFKPLVSGNYVFFVCTDDDGDLFLSTDATPANKRQVAAETGWSGIRNWTGANGNGVGLTAAQSVAQKRSDQWVPDPLAPPPTPPFASGIPLVAGTSYYIELAADEGGGGDNFAATFKLVGEPDPAPGDASRLSGFVLAPFVQALDGAYINVTNFPPAVAGVQSRNTTLTIGATSGYIGDTSTASPGLAYQWQSAPSGSSTFTNIPNAGAASYTTPVLALGNSGTQYRVALQAGDATTNSSIATLSVTPDTTAPRPVQVTSVNPAGTVVTLTFDELMDTPSAQTGANYVFTPGNVAGASAILAANGTTVTITTASPLLPNVTNTLTITAVKDLAGNTVAANTTIQFMFDPVTYAENILFDGPLGYYRFEETSGSVATNSGSTGGDAVYSVGNEPAPRDGGAPGTAKGDPGPRPPTFVGFDANNRSATFGGPSTEDWVDTRNQFLQNRAAFTLEYWVSPANRVSDPGTFGNRVAIVGQNDAIEYGFITPTTIQIWTYPPPPAVPSGGGALDTTYSFPDNEWHHVATIASGTDIRNYFDGVLVGTGGGPTTNYGTNGIYNVHIGGGGGFDALNNWFTGQIDEVAIFDKAIPAARVAAHFQAGKTGGVITTSGAVTPAANFMLTASKSGSNLTISWTPSGGTLESTPVLAGASTVWSTVGPANPANITIGTGNSFYRVRSP